MTCCNNGMMKELINDCHKDDCGCGDHKCEPILDVASPVEGQTLIYSEQYKAFMNQSIRFKGIVSGTGTPNGLGGNCPAVNPTTPYVWIQIELQDGSIVYMPAWK